MRRRPGIQGLQKRQAEQGQCKALGDELASAQLARMQQQLTAFKNSLQEFAFKHRAAIKQDPVFRAQFHQMCAHAGVDPLASNKGMWAQMLGLGDFYYELGVQVVEVCLATREENGGLIGLHELHQAVVLRRGAVADAVSEDDLISAIKQLKVLGGGFGVVNIGNKKLVSSVPRELNRDHNALFELAQGTGYVTMSGVQQRFGWNRERAASTVDALLKECMALVDDGAPDGERRYWLPAIMPNDDRASGAS